MSSCSVPGCEHRRQRECCRFFRVNAVRLQLPANLRRELLHYQQVCSCHFENGAKCGKWIETTRESTNTSRHTKPLGRTRFRVEDQHGVATKTEFTAIPHIVTPTNAPVSSSVLGHVLDLSNIQEVPDHVRNTSRYSIDELAKTLYIYQRTGYLCDTILVAEDGQLMAHGAVLAAASPLFKSSLVELKSQVIQRHIVLRGIKLHVLKIALHFMYTGDIVIPPEYCQPDTMQSIIVSLLRLGLRIGIASKSDSNSLVTCSPKSEEEDLEDIKPAVVSPNNDTSAQPTSDIVSAACWQVPVQLLAPVTITQQQCDKFTERAASVKQSLCSGPVDISLLKQVDEPPYRGIRLCEFCGKVFNGYSKFTDHLSIHTGQKKFACKVCEKRFSFKPVLDTHMLGHTEQRPHVCEVCGKSYRCIGSLQEHRLSQHALGPKVRWGQRTAKVYECSVCKRQFLKNVRLLQHMRSHTGEKPFQCTECLRKFARKPALICHMRRHTGETPYLCEDCGCSFSVASSYYAHRIKHHGYQKKHRTPPAARIISTTME